VTIMEISAVVLALSGLTVGVTVVVGLTHMLPVLRDASTFLRDANQTLLHIKRVTDDAEDMVRNARRLEGRLSSTIGSMLDHVEPPVRWLGAVGTALRIGTAAFRRSPHTNSNSNHERSTHTKKEVTHE